MTFAGDWGIWLRCTIPCSLLLL